MGKYKELEDTVAEVYRKREAIMKEFNYDPKAYNEYIMKKQEALQKAGVKFVTLEKTDKKPFYAQ